MTLHIFSYGSNLLLARLRARVPSARFVARGKLTGHALRWHKLGEDGSGKCDALETKVPQDCLWGGVFEIDEAHKPLLDAAEGLGFGYDEKYADIECLTVNGDPFVQRSSLYVALKTDPAAIPYGWYKAFVVAGAHECGLPAEHIQALKAVGSIEDADRQRDRRNRYLLPAPFRDI